MMKSTVTSHPNLVIAAATVLGSAVLAWFFTRSAPQKQRVPVRREKPQQLDRVDEAGYDSFPASDPPAY